MVITHEISCINLFYPIDIDTSTPRQTVHDFSRVPSTFTLRHPLTLSKISQLNSTWTLRHPHTQSRISPGSLDRDTSTPTEPVEHLTATLDTDTSTPSALWADNSMSWRVVRRCRRRRRRRLCTTISQKPCDNFFELPALWVDNSMSIVVASVRRRRRRRRRRLLYSQISKTASITFSSYLVWTLSLDTVNIPWYTSESDGLDTKNHGLDTMRWRTVIIWVNGMLPLSGLIRWIVRNGGHFYAVNGHFGHLRAIFSKTVLINLFSYFGKWTTNMTSLVQCERHVDWNAPSLLSVVYRALHFFSVEFFSQKHNFSLYPRRLGMLSVLHKIVIGNWKCMQWHSVRPKMILIRITIRIWCDFENLANAKWMQVVRCCISLGRVPIMPCFGNNV